MSELAPPAPFQTIKNSDYGLASSTRVLRLLSCVYCFLIPTKTKTSKENSIPIFFTLKK